MIFFVFFSRTTEPILTKLSTQNLWIKGILCVWFFFQMKGYALFQGDTLAIWGKLINAIINKNSSLDSLRQFQPTISENIVRLRELECVKWRKTPFSIGRKSKKSKILKRYRYIAIVFSRTTKPSFRYLIFYHLIWKCL